MLCCGVPAVLGGCLVPHSGVGTVLVTVPGDDRARASASASARIKRRRRPRPRATRCQRRCLLRWRHVTVCVVRVKASLCGDMEGDRGQSLQGLQRGWGDLYTPLNPSMAPEPLFPGLYVPTVSPGPFVCPPTTSPRTIGHPRALRPNSLSLLGLWLLPPQGSMFLEQVQP